MHRPKLYCETTWISNIANVANYSQSYGNAAYTVNDAIWSLFAQDDYRVTRKLTVNAGLRYERQTFTDANLNFAPRAGFDWNIFGDGSTVVRGGFGIYYSQIVDNDEANYALTGPTGVFTYTATPTQVGFPTSFAAAPLPVFPTGAVMPLRTLYLRPGLSSYYNQFFPTSTLVGYPGKLLNPYSEQYTASIEQQLAGHWVLQSITSAPISCATCVRWMSMRRPSFTRTSQYAESVLQPELHRGRHGPGDHNRRPGRQRRSTAIALCGSPSTRQNGTEVRSRQELRRHSPLTA